MVDIVLPSRFARQIGLEGAGAYPSECCGILFGSDVAGQRVIERLEPVPNVFDQAERAHRFSISPERIMRAERHASEHGYSVVGFYHSHPDHLARPSEFDRTNAWPYYSYVIVSILNGEPGDLTSWVLDDETKTFIRQEIIEAE